MAQRTDQRSSMARMDHDAETIWIYNQRLAYHTLRQIAAMAQAQAVRNPQGQFSLAGGLGRTISLSTIRLRLKEAAEAHTEELAELVSDYRAISLARYEEQARVTTAQIERLLERAGYVYKRGMEWGAVDLDEKAEKLLQGAILSLTRIEERIDKLLGTDAPLEVAVSVEHYDAEALELKAMLDAAAGEPKRKKAHA